jgi:AcrR family transcriptional regulator
MAGRTTARGRARREQLLDVALEAFAAQGYRGTSVGAIAERVGLSEPGLLHHYPTKVALLQATLEHHQLKTRTAAYAPLDGRMLSFPERLERLAAGHEADAGFVRLLLVIAAESIAADHPTHDWFVARYDTIRSAIERELAADQGSGMLAADVDVHALARLVVAIMDGLEFQFLLAGGKLDIVTPLRQALDLFYLDRSWAT